MNSKIRTARLRSPERTRPPLERECRAPDAVACSHAAAGSVHRVRSVRQLRPSPLGSRPPDRPRRPSGGSTARLVRTLVRGHPDRDRREPVQPSVDEIQASKAGGFWPCGKPPAKVCGAPPNRVNFTLRGVADRLLGIACVLLRRREL